MHPPVERCVVNVSGAFQQLLATNVAGIQLNYGVTFQLGTEMSASRLSNARRPVISNALVVLRPFLPGCLNLTFREAGL
jgi:hypothetical protein